MTLEELAEADFILDRLEEEENTRTALTVQGIGEILVGALSALVRK